MEGIDMPRLLYLTERGYATYTRRRVWSLHEAAALLNGQPPHITPQRFAAAIKGESDLCWERYYRILGTLQNAIEEGKLHQNADKKLKARDVVRWAARECLPLWRPLRTIDLPLNLTKEEEVLYRTIRDNPGLQYKQLADQIADDPEEPYDIDPDRIRQKLIGRLRRKLEAQGFGTILGRCPGYRVEYY
jgi:hypothetical protein